MLLFFFISFFLFFYAHYDTMLLFLLRYHFAVHIKKGDNKEKCDAALTRKKKRM